MQDRQESFSQAEADEKLLVDRMAGCADIPHEWIDTTGCFDLSRLDIGMQVVLRTQCDVELTAEVTRVRDQRCHARIVSVDGATISHPVARNDLDTGHRADPADWLGTPLVFGEEKILRIGQ